MDKRFVIFIVISVAILYFSTNFTMQRAKEKQQKTAQFQTQSTKTTETKEKNISKAETRTENPEKEQTFDYENEITKIIAGNIGGIIKALTVKTKLAGKQGKINFIENAERGNNFQFDCRLNDERLLLAEKAWNINGQGKELVFSYYVENKIKVVKKIEFKEDYTAKIEIDISNLEERISEITKPQIAWSISKDTQNASNIKEAVIYTSTKIYRFKPKKKSETQSVQEKPEWAGLKDQYFCWIYYGTEPKIESVEIQYEDDQSMKLYLNFPEMRLNPLENKKISIKTYLGPQNYVELKKLGYQIYKIVHFGFFHVIGVPLYYTLRFFFSLTRNYGLSIILLTILIRILLWWPTQKSYSSMKKMQTAMNKMQPRLKTLKEIYKNDPSKLNEETMKLYREYQINPMGGCLPMLLQMPIFFALYSTLVSAVELKGAEFVWFWKDLSAKDPYYVLPLLMGITMFIQQKISTPPAATPEAAAQQKMMLYFMPPMLTFFAFVWPSGLLLYWVISNILSISQQMMINQSR